MAAAKLTATAIQCRLGTQLALNDISFTAEPGQLTGIIGTNGAGKSTLLSILAGVQNNFRGSVSVGSKQLEQMTCRCLRTVGVIKLSIQLYQSHFCESRTYEVLANLDKEKSDHGFRCRRNHGCVFDC